jgi:3-oxoacyl-(acyl-carrier-protein) synthase
MPRNVYVTGRGAVSPAGASFAQSWQALQRGKPCFTLDDDLGYLGRLAPDAEEAVAGLRLDRRLKVHDRAVLLGVLAARQAWSEARGAREIGRLGERPPGRAAVVMGSSRGATGTIERELESFAASARVSLQASPTTTAGAFASTISQDLGLDGLSLALSSACTTGLNALGVAFSLVSGGFADHALAGGAEASLTKFTLAQLDAVGVRTAKRGSALYPCRPMHPQRSGLLAAEGAACLALSARPESLGGGPLAQVLGFGAATEGATLTGISSDGQVLVNAIEQALEQAGLDPGGVDLVVGHGAGTMKGDAAELTAYRRVFGAAMPALTFHKWLVGHMIGASAAFSAALAVRVLETGEVPPLPYADADELGFLAVPVQRVETVLVTALGFGGNASALVLGR